MASAIAEEKKALRQQVRGELTALSEQARRASDDALFARFLALPQVERAQTIFAFLGVLAWEPETARLIDALLARGKTVGLPRMLPSRGMEVRRYDPDVPLVPASFGILEPGEDCPILKKETIDLALVPALCYDRRGYRLGVGGGYYDRWLEGYSGVRVGLCRGRVLRDRLPVEAHDSRVDTLLTEEECMSL